MERLQMGGGLLLLALGVVACNSAGATIPTVSTPTGAIAPTVNTPTPLPPSEPPELATGTPLPGNLDGVTFIEDDQEYSINPLLPRDAILPIYDPVFILAADSSLSPDAMVMGIEINGDARAYPVGILRSREMVNDEVGGTPILVTW